MEARGCCQGQAAYTSGGGLGGDLATHGEVGEDVVGRGVSQVVQQVLEGALAGQDGLGAVATHGKRGHQVRRPDTCPAAGGGSSSHPVPRTGTLVPHPNMATMARRPFLISLSLSFFISASVLPNDSMLKKGPPG